MARHFIYKHLPGSGLGHRDPRRPHVTGGLGLGLPVFITDIIEKRIYRGQGRDQMVRDRSLLNETRDLIAKSRYYAEGIEIVPACNILKRNDHNQVSSIGSWLPDTYSPYATGTCTIERVNRLLAGTTSNYEIQIDPDYAFPVESVMISLGSDSDMALNYPVTPGVQYSFSALSGNLDEGDGEVHLAVSWYNESGDLLYFIEGENRVGLGNYPDEVVVAEVFGTGFGSDIRYMRMHLIVEPADPYDALVFARDFSIVKPPSYRSRVSRYRERLNRILDGIARTLSAIGRSYRGGGRSMGSEDRDLE